MTSGRCVILAGLSLAFAAISPALAFDRNGLVRGGEVYVVALHDAYVEAAVRPEPADPAELSRFFRQRAVEIEMGGELFPTHPSAYPSTDQSQQLRLGEAFDETFEVATSEAADVEPDLTAAVQVAYERWLITAYIDGEEADEAELAAAFEDSLDALTQPSIVSSLMEGFGRGEAPAATARERTRLRPRASAGVRDISGFRLIGTLVGDRGI